MRRSLALTAVGLLTLCVVGILCDLSIECYPNKTIIMENPEPDYFTHCVANDSEKMCGVQFSDNYTHMYINDCNLGDKILVSLTNRTGLETIIGGFGSSLYVIQCNSVGDGGVNRTISQTLLPSMPFSSVTPQTIIYAETTFREHNSSGQELTAASVGERITWTMECAEEHFLRILNCTAYGGQNTASEENAVLILDGCSQDFALVSTHFDNDVYDVINGEKRYYADFHVFKFFGYDHVTISCSVRVCPPNDNICTMPGCGRRKRYAVTEEANNGDVMYQDARATIRVLETLSGANIIRIDTCVWILLVVVIYLFSENCS